MNDNAAKRNIEAVYPLSPMQQGMLFHSLYAPESGAYFEQFSCVLRGELNLAAFEAAWREVTKRQTVLRTSFVWKRLDRMLQVVQKEVELPLLYQDWSGESSNIEDKLAAFLVADRAKGFNLAKPPLMRLGLFRIAVDAHYFVWSHHHALMDGWSMPLLLKEVLTYYDVFNQGKTIHLTPTRPYRDYIAWLQEQDVNAAEAYWRFLLNGVKAPTPLVIDQAKSGHQSAGTLGGHQRIADQNQQTRKNQEQEILLSKESTARIIKLARMERLTLSTLIQAAWGILLWRYSGEENILFGATVSGRPTELVGAESMIGLFINTLPVRVTVQAQETLGSWLQALQRQTVDTRQFEYSSLVQIQEWSEIPRGFPLFESILVFENYPVEETLRGNLSSEQKLTIEQFHSYEQTNYPLTVVSGPGEELGIKISYNPTRFDSQTIQRVLAHFKTILESISADYEQTGLSSRRLEDVNLLSPDEETQILSDFVNRFAIRQEKFGEIRHDCTIHELFEAQAQATPQALAVVLDNQGEQNSNADSLSITYGELNARADLLAEFLSDSGVGPGVFVGLFVDRSPEMIIGMLGILKAGAAYLPLDPNYPMERIEFMLEDTQTQVVLTQAHLKDSLPSANLVRSDPDDEQQRNRRVFSLDSDWGHIISAVQQKRIHREKINQFDSNNLAYVIYTSGSTGKPKGVLVEHHSLVNLATNYASLTDLGSHDRVLQFISLGFDASAEEIFPALIRGATLVLPRSPRELTTADFIGLIERQAVTLLHLPAAFWHRCVDDMQASQELPGEELAVPVCIRCVVVGGESPSVEKLRSWKNLSAENPGLFINAYGPTETTVAATYYKLDLRDANALELERLPIGKGLVNNRVYILDADLRIVPIGLPGELCVGGEGVARGYLNQPELTAEKIVQMPPQLVPRLLPNKETISPQDLRLYRTGDLVRYLPDGNIEFLGRVDQQVKIRGFRIELGEIEAVLEKHPTVKESAVLARQDYTGGDRRLVAYIVPKNVDQSRTDNAAGVDHRVTADPLTSSEIKAYLHKNLPDYMVPAVILMLDAMPLTPNGKIDRQALPAPDGEVIASDSVYAPPRTPVEALLCGAWEQILDLPRVGIFDNFFDLGGHSLIATQVISRLRNVFHVEIPLRDLFEAPTVAGLAEQIEKQLRFDAGIGQPLIVPIPRSEQTGLPIEPPQLSFSQQRLWFLDQLAPGNLFYMIPLAVEIDGPLDPAALKKTLDEIIARHAILRTNIKSVGGKPLQFVRSDLILELPIIDLTELPEADRKVKAEGIARQEAQQAFDLENDPLIRAKLITLGKHPLHGFDRYVFILIMHHIISDGWSMRVFLHEVETLYRAFSAGKPSPLPDLKIQYFDYADWQRNWLRGEQLERQLDYWKQQLENQPRILDLPTDRPRPAVQSSRGATLPFHISAAVADKIAVLNREEGTTLFMTLLAVFQILLSRYSGQEDISVGTAIANRNNAEIENLIGFFVNTLVFRTELSGEPTFKEVLKRVREVALGAYAHQDLPFETLVEALQPDRDLSHTPLFQVAFALQNAQNIDSLPFVLAQPGSNAAAKDELIFKLLQVDSGSAKFDLTMTLAETTDGLMGGIEYNLDLFFPETIQRMIIHFSTLLENLILDPNQPVSKVPLLSKAEQEMLLVNWNTTDAPAPLDRCAHELVESWAIKTPAAPALCFADQTLTYRELDWRAEAVANYLRQGGVKVGTLVGISTERSLQTIIGILGVMKAGGAYVPLDPSYPADRLAYMIEDSQIPVLLTQERLLERLPLQAGAGLRVICLDREWEEIERSPRLENERKVEPEDLAYIIYTSGSTGRPKGTMLRHRGLSNLTEVQRTAFDIAGGKRVLQFSSLSFDASVAEIFVALANGATLVLAAQETLASAPDLLNLLKEQRVTTVTLPPTVLRLYSAEQVSIEALPALQTVVSAGEACTPDLVSVWKPGREFFNGYGPTESTVCATLYLCSDGEVGQPPIGKPIANTKVYILDRHAQPVPVGVNGELHVSGVSLAVGYIHQPDMTATRFIDNPFERENPDFSRMYKTGDLVRYRPDGNIEYLGRIDQQVKVRGFRIELDEIENQLLQAPGVADAVVIAREDVPGEKQLVAYLVMEGESGSFNISALRNHLKIRLPDYMIPSLYVSLERIPLLPNGKVNRKGLPKPEGLRPDIGAEFEGPRSETERILAEIWGQVLKLDQVGIRDNFFDLGGDSILSIQVVSKANQVGIHITPKQIFEAQTIAGLAALAGSGLVVSAEQGLVTGSLPLTAIENWFFGLGLPNPSYFNQALILEVNQRLDPNLLKIALIKLVEHHDVLRLRVNRLDREGSLGPIWSQTIDGMQDYPVGGDTNLFEYRDISLLPQAEQKVCIEQYAGQVQGSLNITSGPLLRMVYFDAGSTANGRVLIVIHHLGIDGISWRVILEDLQSAYEQLAMNIQITSTDHPDIRIQLPPKTTSFLSWAQQIDEYARSTQVLSELDYWVQVIDNPSDQVLLDFPEGKNTNEFGRHVRRVLEKAETRLLLQEVPTAYKTEINDLLLTALVIAYREWLAGRSVWPEIHGETNLLLALEGHGREELFPGVNLTRTVGWFTSIYPVRLTIKDFDSQGDMIRKVKEQLRAIPNRGIGYGLLRYMNPVSQQVLSTFNQPQISFNYLGQFGQVDQPGMADQAESPKPQLFGIAPESSGETQSRDAQKAFFIEMNGGISGGQLGMEWSYSSAIFTAASINSFADQYVQALHALIQHCLSPDAGGFTSSDFPLAGLEQSTLDKVVAKIGIQKKSNSE